MTFSDEKKMERLRHTFDLNYRITQLYATYLERFPDFIKKEYIDELTGDGRIDIKDALVALLSLAFGLDDERGGDDRAIIRNYLTPSIRILDTKKYTENKYYKNIKIENIKDGDWEFKLDSYPAFRGVISADMIFEDGYREIPPLGFFTEEFSFPAVLEGGNEWMTLTPVDIDTVEDQIAAAHGKVITFGLGLGYYAYMVSEKEDVESITVVEKSENVIRLFERHILPQFAHREKVRVIHADAFEYAEHIMPREHYDYAFADTWRDASDGVPMYKRMKPLETGSPDTVFDYWIEGFIRSRLRAMRFEELYRMVEYNEVGAPRSYDEFEDMLKRGI